MSERSSAEPPLPPAVEEFLLRPSYEVLADEDALLERVGALHSMEYLVKMALQDTVDAARVQGLSWQKIGDAAGVSQQSAMQRWKDDRVTDRRRSPRL